jgi:hypothetical protein
MAYASQIPITIVAELLAILDKKLEGHTIISKLFIIQYTYFEFEHNKWVMKTFLDIGKETIKDIYLDISSCDVTNINIYAKHPGYIKLQIKNKLDMRNKSIPGKIYACDLYEDFEPEHYIGKCFTA